MSRSINVAIRKCIACVYTHIVALGRFDVSSCSDITSSSDSDPDSDEELGFGDLAFFLLGVDFFDFGLDFSALFFEDFGGNEAIELLELPLPDSSLSAMVSLLKPAFIAEVSRRGR